MTQKERSELRGVLRDPRLHKAMNEVLASLPMAKAEEDFSKPFNNEMAGNHYYFHAGALAAFNSLMRLGYSLSDSGKANQRVTVPQFREEKKL